MILIWSYIILIYYTHSNSIICEGDDACYTQTIECIDNQDCFVQCSGSQACRDTIIKCPIKYQCHIKCYNAQGTDVSTNRLTCYRMIIDAKQSTILTITADFGDTGELPALRALEEITIYCPHNGRDPSGKNPCQIICNGDDLIRQSEIYAVAGFNDLYIESHFYNAEWCIRAAEVHCKQDYSASCHMKNFAPFACQDIVHQITDQTCETYTLAPTFPSTSPTSAPTSPTSAPTSNPTLTPTINPTSAPTKYPTSATNKPTSIPTDNPASSPTSYPSATPTKNPTYIPSYSPSKLPTRIPSHSPTLNPVQSPTNNPTLSPTQNPAPSPTSNPTAAPTHFPSVNPTSTPSNNPTLSPTNKPTAVPTNNPTLSPTSNPTTTPSNYPTPVNPTPSPTNNPALRPTYAPITPTSSTNIPTSYPTATLSNNPTTVPTSSPTNTDPIITEYPTTHMPTSEPTSKPTTLPIMDAMESPIYTPTENEGLIMPSKVESSNGLITSKLVLVLLAPLLLVLACICVAVGVCLFKGKKNSEPQDIDGRSNTSIQVQKHDSEMVEESDSSDLFQPGITTSTSPGDLEIMQGESHNNYKQLCNKQESESSYYGDDIELKTDDEYIQNEYRATSTEDDSHSTIDL